MFSALRQGSLFYILEKGETPILKVGQVQSVSQPMPKYGTMPAVGQFGVETFVDISVKVGDNTMDFKQLPSSQSIANFGNNGVVVAETKEMMISEVDTMINTSRQIVDSVDYHKKVLASCDNIMRELNPRFAKELEQEEKITSLESRMGGIENTLTDMKDMLSKALSKSSSKNS